MCTLCLLNGVRRRPGYTIKVLQERHFYSVKIGYFHSRKRALFPQVQSVGVGGGVFAPNALRTRSAAVEVVFRACDDMIKMAIPIG